MNRTYKILMALAIVGGGFVSGGIVPAGFAAVFTAIGTAAALWHSKPGDGK